MPTKSPRKRLYIPTGNPRGRPKKIRPQAADVAPVAVEPSPPAARAAYRVAEAARAIGVSRSAMKRLVQKGLVRSVTLGRMRLIPTDALSELLGGKSMERGA
jgi:excisionase family DNA binding protein